MKRDRGRPHEGVAHLLAENHLVQEGAAHAAQLGEDGVALEQVEIFPVVAAKLIQTPPLALA